MNTHENIERIRQETAPVHRSAMPYPIRRPVPRLPGQARWPRPIMPGACTKRLNTGRPKGRISRCLGALAGFGVTWFVTPENAPSIVASLGPFALAFVAGYSVEPFSGALDKVVSACLEKRDDHRRKSAAE